MFSAALLGGYDVPETRSYQITLDCPIGADVRQAITGEFQNMHKVAE